MSICVDAYVEGVRLGTVTRARINTILPSSNGFPALHLRIAIVNLKDHGARYDKRLCEQACRVIHVASVDVR